ncbi:MAG: hypothetical protein QM804_01200 [Propionicimonas sp.]
MNPGVWRWSELAAEHGRDWPRGQVASGQLRRIGHGWYAAPAADNSVVRAVQLGGRLGCLSACGAHGLWVPPGQDLHVTFNRRAPGSMPPGVVGHHDRELGSEPAVRPLLSALTEVVRNHDTETALIVLDSAINRGMVTEADVICLANECPKPKRRVLRYLDGRADSGTETRVRYFFQRRGVPVEPQVYVPSVGRVDLRVGRSLLIECDSWAHHTGEENYRKDRGRDLILIPDANRVLRLTFEQVFYQWPATQLALIRMVRARLHRPLPLSAR